MNRDAAKPVLPSDHDPRPTLRERVLARVRLPKLVIPPAWLYRRPCDCQNCRNR